MQEHITQLPTPLQEAANNVSRYYSHSIMWKHILKLQESNSKNLYKEVVIWSLASYIKIFKTNKLKDIFETCSFCFLVKVNCSKCNLSCTKNKVFNSMIENKKALTKENILLWLESMNYWSILIETYNREL